MKTRTIFGKIFPLALNALILLCFLSIVMSNSVKADVISGEFKWWNLGANTSMKDGFAIQSGSIPLPPYEYNYPFLQVSLPSSTDVSYNDYGLHVSTQSFNVAFDIYHGNYGQPITFSPVSGDFTWTNELWIDGNLVYTKDAEYLGVDISLTGTSLAIGAFLDGTVSLSHTDDYYYDLMGYLNSGESSVSLAWKIVNVNGFLYDTATHDSLQEKYGTDGIVFSPYSTLSWEGQLNIAYEYNTASGATPEPASMLIFGISSLVGGGFLVRRKMNRKR